MNSSPIYIPRFLNDMVTKLFKTIKLSSKIEKLKRRTLGLLEIEIEITVIKNKGNILCSVHIPIVGHPWTKI
jgi:hypothetical protein